MHATLDPIQRQPVSEALYRQLKGRILSGDFQPGERLPSERVLSEASGINRGAVREAIKRLQQAGLIAVRQGGNHEVLDFLQEAGPELLPSLLIGGEGFSPKVVCDLMAMRSLLAPEIGAAAARRGSPALHATLSGLCDDMRSRQADLPALQRLALAFWQALVVGSDNVAFRLSFNAMRKSYLQAWDALTLPMAEEFRDIERLQTIADAVANRDANAALVAAKANVALGEAAIRQLFGSLA
jgi:DNA-binding FadR family transcriptional regulator